MAELTTLSQLSAPPQADSSRPWTEEHARTWELVCRYEAAVRHYRPRFRLGGFLRRDPRTRQQIDPRDVMAFKSCFRHLDRCAEEVSMTAEELIAAFAEHYGPATTTDAFFHKPNVMLNRGLARMVLDRWRGNIAGKTGPGEAPGRARAQTAQATALLRERAAESIRVGWARLGLFLFKGRLAARFEPWWVEVVPDDGGPLGAADTLRDPALLTRLERARVARPLAPVVQALLDGRGWAIPDGFRELAVAPAVGLVDVMGPDPARLEVVRRHRRRWWDFVVGWLLTDGRHASREFLWGIAEGIVPMPKVVQAEAREAMGMAAGVAGDDYDPARRWTRSCLAEWHRDAWASELDPLLLVLAEAERTGRTADPFAGGWAGPEDPTPTSRTYTKAEAARLRERAPKYL